MSTSTNTSLFNALGFFLEKMRPYVIAVIEKAAPGKPWEGEMFRWLNPEQQRSWNMTQRSLTESGGNTANLIDYSILFTFGVSYKDALKQEVGNYPDVNKLINYFKELKEVRNKCQHFQELDEDEITRAYLNMKGAAKLLEMQDVYDEIHRIQNGDKVETNTSPQHSQFQTLTPSAPVVPVENSDDSLPSWFNFALPHYDIRNGQLDESIFAANLSEVALGTGPDVYTNPNLFFAKTYVTDGLRDISTRVVQALNGEEVNVELVTKDPTGQNKYLFGAPVFPVGNYQFQVSAHENYYYNNEHTRIPDIVSTCLGASDGLFIFDLCHIKMYDYWSSFKSGIDAYLKTVNK